jgi:AcrR family transcriptional regulator
MARRRRRGAGAASTKERILDSAEAVFAELGFAGTRTRAIARHARVGLATLHFHWHSKQELYAAVYERLLARRRRHGEQLFALIGQRVLAGTPPGEIVQAAVEHLVSFYRLHPHAARLYAYQFLEAKRPSVTLEPEPLRELLLTMARQVRGLLPAAVAGALDVELTLLTFNLVVLVSFINPAVMSALLGERDPAALEERLTRHLRETLVRLLAGARAPTAGQA